MARTIAQVIEALQDNADFEEVASVAKAKAFVTAAREYLILAPNSSSDAGSSMTINADQIERQLHRAQNYARINSTGGSTRFLGLSSDFRG